VGQLERIIEKAGRRKAWAIVLMEEMTEELRNRLREDLREMLARRRERFVTITVPIELRDHYIHTSERVFYREGIGRLREFTVWSPNTNFSIQVETNEGEVISDTYSNLEAISKDVDFLVAMQVNSEYMVKISDIAYDGWIRIFIHVTKPTTFSRIMILHDIIRTR